MSPNPTLCHAAAHIPLGITASSGCFLEGSSSTVITCLGAARGPLLLLRESSLSTGCRELQGGQHSLASPSHPLCSHKHCWAVEEAVVLPQHQQLPIPEQPEASGLPRGVLLLWPLKCQPREISAVGFKWETNLSRDLGKDNQSRRGLHLLPKQGLPAAKAFDSPAPPCFLQRESANLALTFTEISEFSIQGRKGRW